jgi:hypothetical protein
MKKLIGYKIEPIYYESSGGWVMNEVTDCILCGKLICGHLINANLCIPCANKVLEKPLDIGE